MAYDVFISYSSKDKLAAQAACAVLERSGVRCWMAPRDILPGMGWGASIVGAIHGARAMVLVFSGNANASPQIEREVERAISKGVPVIPFRIEDVLPSHALEYFISASHWLDAFTPPLEQHLEHLAEVVRRVLELKQDSGASPDREGAPELALAAGAAPSGRASDLWSDRETQPVPAKPSAVPRSPRAMMFAAAAVAGLTILAGGGYAVFRMQGPAVPAAPVASLAAPPVAAAEPPPVAIANAAPPSQQVQPVAVPQPVGSGQTPSGEPATDFRVKECDRLAANPLDAGRPAGTTGVALGKIDVPLAIANCRAAMEAFPHEGRAVYNLARAKAQSGDYKEAIDLMISAAGLGYPAAMAQLGQLYAAGQAVAKDYGAALAWYNKAAAAGNAAAMDGLGDLYFNGLGVAKDYGAASSWYLKAANGGNATAMYAIAGMYTYHQGVAEDEKTALDWYLKAARAGSADGMYSAGWQIALGQGTPTNLAEGARWLLLALKSGSSDARADLISQKGEGEDTTSEFRMAVQDQLRGAGVFKGKTDGTFGPDTIAALELYASTP